MSKESSSSPSFSVGQVWKYKTRPHETDSRLTIVRIDSDDYEYGDIIHIYISSVDIPNPDAPGGKTIYIAHLPYQEDALSESVTELETSTKELPDYQKAYKMWKESFDKSKAGVFDIGVSEAVGFLEQSVN